MLVEGLDALIEKHLARGDVAAVTVQLDKAIELQVADFEVNLLDDPPAHSFVALPYFDPALMKSKTVEQMITQSFESYVVKNVEEGRRVQALGMMSDVVPLITRLLGATNAPVQISAASIIGLAHNQLSIVLWHGNEGRKTDEGRKLIDALRSAVYRALKEPGAVERLTRFERSE